MVRNTRAMQGKCTVENKEDMKCSEDVSIHEGEVDQLKAKRLWLCESHVYEM